MLLFLYMSLSLYLSVVMSVKVRGVCGSAGLRSDRKPETQTQTVPVMVLQPESMPADSHADADPDPPLLNTQTQAQTYLDLCSICVGCNLMGGAQRNLAIIV